MIRNIRGAGGGKSGGGSQHTPSEDPDSLRSKQYARIIDLVSEGEIEGLVDGLKSVYLDGVPIQNEDGSNNFQDVIISHREGTQDQEYIPGFPSVESEIAVGEEVKYSTSITKTIVDSNLTSVRVTLSVPQLTFQDPDSGDLRGTSVEIAIDLQTDGGGYVAQPLRKIWSPVSASGATYSNTDTFGIGATVTVDTILHDNDYITYRVEYKASSSGTWIPIKTVTFTSRDTPPAVSWGGDGETEVTYVFPTRDFFTDSLPQDDYDIRVVKVGGTGSAYFTKTYDYIQVFTDVISGKTTSRYQRSYLIPLTGSQPWDIRVRRLTVDSTEANRSDKTFWDSYTEIVDTKFSYPNSALVAIQIDASQFNAIPQRGFDIRGLKIQIPSNYNPSTREYTGSWDGTFVTGWTDNPAWCYYDILTSNRYGLGDYIDVANVDKWELYAIAQYCDELVPDGLGHMEPRFSCNLFLQTQEQAYTVVVNMASIFRAMTWWGGGLITAAQDRPSDPVMSFTSANIIGGQFTYSGSSRRARHTVALVSWIDPRNGYKQSVEYVEDQEGITRYGVVSTDVVAFGCTSRGQAHRIGKWLLYSERLETEVIAFQTGFDGVYIYPGSIIQTTDPNRSGVRFGGRILDVNASSDQITIDSTVTIESGKTYQLTCQLPDGTLETRDITNSPGDVTVLTLGTAFSDMPQTQSIWILVASDLVPELWRVISVTEVEKGKLEISALAHNPSKYDAIELGLTLQPLPTTYLSSVPDQPIDLAVEESLYLAALGVVGVKAQISWQSTSPRFLVSYRRENENWIQIETHNTSIEILGLSSGIYDFSVVAITPLGIRSSATTLTQEIYGKTLPPVDITGFSVIKSTGVAIAQWDPHPDLDVQVGGEIIIRFTPSTVGAAWTDGIIYGEYPGSAIGGQLPLVTGTYMAKAKDSSNNYSTGIATFVATEGLVTGFTTVANSTQDSTFPGTLTDLIIDSGQLEIASTGSPLIGTYEFDTYLDMTTVATRRFEADITAVSFVATDLIDDRTDLIDTWDSFDGDVVNDCDATLYAATTDDDPSGTPTWGPWTPFFVADFTCRATKFKLELTREDITHNIAVSVLRVDVKEPV